MGEDRLGGVLEVVGDHEGPPAHQRQGLGTSLPRQTPPGRDAEREGLVATGRLDHLEQVLEQLVRDMNLLDEILHLHHLAPVEHRFELLELRPRAAGPQQFELLLAPRVTH